MVVIIVEVVTVEVVKVAVVENHIHLRKDHHSGLQLVQFTLILNPTHHDHRSGQLVLQLGHQLESHYLNPRHQNQVVVNKVHKMKMKTV